MAIDRNTLQLAAPVLCTVGSALTLLAALFGSGRTKTSVLSALMGTIGSAAWTATALQDAQDTSTV